jgi:CHAT domain-containing protein
MHYLLDLGDANNMIGNIARGFDYANQALESATSLNNRIVQAASNLSLGEVYMNIGAYERAIDHLKLSLVIYETIKQEVDTQGSIKEKALLLSLGPSIPFYLGYAYLAMDQENNAVAYFQQSIVAATNMPALQEFPRGPLAIAYLLGGDRQKAAEMLTPIDCRSLYSSLYHLLVGRSDLAVKCISSTELTAFPKEFFSILPRNVAVGINTILGLAYEKIGDIKTAQAAFERAVVLLEKQRERLREEDRVNFISAKDYPPLDRLSPYEGLVRIATVDDSFSYSESMKARVLMEHMVKTYGVLREKTQSSDQVRATEIDNSIADLLKAQEVATTLGDNDLVINYEKEIYALHERLNPIIQRLYEENPAYAAAKYPRSLRPQQVLLYPQEVLIEFSVTSNKSLAWLLKDGSVKKQLSIDIEKKELEGLVNKYLLEIGTPEGAQNPKRHYETGNRLYKILLEPFAPFILPHDKVIIVPDKFLAALPFEAVISSLPKGEDSMITTANTGEQHISYFGDKHDISYQPSASILTAARVAAKPDKFKKALFMLFDPYFSARQTDYPSLERTVDLATGLENIFPHDMIDSISRYDASERNLKNLDLSKYRYLVFATHGVLSDKVAGIEEPALVLSQNKNTLPDDGFLTISEAMVLNLRSDITVIAACRTAMGRLVPGEGVLGLGRAFQYGGSKSVVASLWPIPEDESNKFVERYFYYLNNGSDKSAALRLARGEMRSEGRAHPFFWAPFILLGENR